MQGPWAFFTLNNKYISVLPSLGASARRLPSWMMDKRKTGSCEPSAAAEEFLMTDGMDWTKHRFVLIETKPACNFWAGGSVKKCQTMWGAADSKFLKIGHWWEWRGFSWFNWERAETQEPATPTLLLGKKQQRVMISCLSGHHSLSTHGLSVESPHFYIPTKHIKKST